MMQSQNAQITLKLSLNEVNLVLTALGDKPYVKVFGLVQKIQQQAGKQLEQSEQSEQTMNIENKKTED